MKMSYIKLWTIGVAVCINHAHAAQPKWWTDSNSKIISGSPVSGLGVANIGQLKHVSVMAYYASLQYMNYYATLGIGLEESAGIKAKITPYWDCSAGVAKPHDKALQYAVLNLGQLKSTAVTYYRWLNVIGYPVRESIESVGGAAYSDGQFWYPWNPSSPRDVNYSPATVGQLKMTFSFDLTKFSGDLDGDGIADHNDADPLNKLDSDAVTVCITFPAAGSYVY